MTSSKKIIWLLVVLLVTAGMMYALYEYNRRPAGLSSTKAVAILDAAQLVRLYETDEGKANTLYLGKPIDVNGFVAEVNSEQDTVTNILLGNKDDMHKVSCLLTREHANKLRLRAGDKVTVRGICTGYLVDVELNRCIIIK